MAGLDAGVLVLAFLAVLAGSTVQAVVGLGMGLVAAPVITLCAPELMPGVLLSLAFVLPVVTLVEERRDIDWFGLGWSLPARVLGTAVGVWVVAAFSTEQLGVLIGVIVLVAVLLTWRAVRVPVNRGTLGVAGFVSGITGTATSIGGPPFALLYQHRPHRQIRTTLAVYFLVGAGISLLGLALVGELSRHEVVVGALLVPALVLGVALGSVLRRRLPAERVREAVLIVSAASAVVLVVRSLL